MSNKNIYVIYAVVFLPIFVLQSCASVKDIPAELKEAAAIQSAETLKYRGKEISIKDIFYTDTESADVHAADSKKKYLRFHWTE